MHCEIMFLFGPESSSLQTVKPFYDTTSPRSRTKSIAVTKHERQLAAKERNIYAMSVPCAGDEQEGEFSQLLGKCKGA